MIASILARNAALRASLLEARAQLCTAYALPAEDAVSAPPDAIQSTAHGWLTIRGSAWWNRTVLRQIERRLMRLFCRSLVPGQRVVVVLRAWNRDNVLCLRRARVVEQDGDVVTVALRGADGTIYRRVPRGQVRTCRAQLI